MEHMYFNYKEISANETDFLKINGRTLYNDGLFISWCNSGVELSFIGSRIEFNFDAYVSEEPVYVKTFTDKSEQRFGLLGAMPKVILEFKSERVHTVKLLRISSGNVPLVLKSVKIFGKNPEFLKAPQEKSLKLEFLGDSITAGFGVLSSSDQDTYHTYEEDSTMTYAYLTAQLLDAEIRTEAWSGQGVYRACSGEEGYSFKRIFDLTLREMGGYDHSQWTPDVVILNCGTNDVPGGTDDENMYKAADFLIDKVRSTYPTAKIVWTFGMMNTKFHTTLSRLITDKNQSGDSNLYYLPLEIITLEKNEIGAIGHPNYNASVRVSKKLAKFIKSII